MPSFQVLCGDALLIVPKLTTKFDAVATDPPYGCRNDCDYTRFGSGVSDKRNVHRPVRGDDQPFDPSPWLKHKKVVLFGYQFFADKLPQGTTLGSV